MGNVVDNIRLKTQPCFFSKDFFAEDRETRLWTWDQLSWSGCVLIIDAISLFHPLIYRRLLQSEMGANNRVAIAAVLLSPMISSANTTSQLVQEQITSRMQRAFVRSAWYWDKLCKHRIREVRQFHEWLDDAIPATVETIFRQKRESRPNPKGLQLMRKRVTKPGVSSLIFKRGGRR